MTLNQNSVEDNTNDVITIEINKWDFQETSSFITK